MHVAAETNFHAWIGRDLELKARERERELVRCGIPLVLVLQNLSAAMRATVPVLPTTVQRQGGHSGLLSVPSRPFRPGAALIQICTPGGARRGRRSIPSSFHRCCQGQRLRGDRQWWWPRWLSWPANNRTRHGG
jgi:hypothetical protein